MKLEELKLRRYLLKDLSNSETEQLEISLMADESLAEALFLAEDNLIEDYLDESLSPEDKNLFKENFLISPRRVEQLQLISLLKKNVHPAARTKTTFLQTGLVSAIKKLKSYAGSIQHPAVAISAVVVVILLTGWLFFLSQPTSDKLTSFETELVKLNQKDFSDLGRYNSLSQINLVSETFRGQSGASQVIKDALTDTVLIRLLVPSTEASESTYRVKLVKADKTLATLDSVQPQLSQSESEIRLLLPSPALEKGTYKIEISQVASGETPVQYTFTVQ